jgi:hypothetical protein
MILGSTNDKRERPNNAKFFLILELRIQAHFCILIHFQHFNCSGLMCLNLEIEFPRISHLFFFRDSNNNAISRGS